MFAIGAVHLLNDSLQAVVPAMFPILEQSMGLTFTQLGIIAFVLNMTSSVLQPVVGFLSDRKPKPYALPIGMSLSLIGITGLAFAPQYWMILLFVVCLGFGSAVFHPEGSRVSFMSAGNKRGLSQSIFQVGGNTGQALAPLIGAYILVPYGQKGAAVFIIVAALAVIMLIKISSWYQRELEMEAKNNRKRVLLSSIGELTKKQIGVALTLLLLIIFARSFYVISITNFYIFHLMDAYQLTITNGQLLIFLFLAVGAAGTFFGGPFADRMGRKNIIILSLAVPIPLCLLLPYVPLWAVAILLAVIGFIIMLSFSVTVVYAQELVPSKIGTMAGLTVGLAFGMGAIGSVVIGMLMDEIGVYYTMIVISFLPIIGLVGLWLPSDRKVTAA
ncbi:MAG TPA: MFS transporter [Sporosarcina sp.]|nr:MFS transporter [Sporosarcina sp.]